MPESSRQQTMRDAHEWDVMMARGTLFPKIQPQAIRRIHVPTLLLSGAKSYPFLELIMSELAHLLPDSQSIVYPDAGHQMWYQKPQECRQDVEDFLQHHGIH
jgi:pimeloyl-ACP methyl ester carboxylesterase